jgi:hypothetical protein
MKGPASSNMDTLSIPKPFVSPFSTTSPLYAGSATLSRSSSQPQGSDLIFDGASFRFRLYLAEAR